jgi:hypothetical protein
MAPSQYGKTYPMAGPLYTANDVYTTKTVVDPQSLQTSTKYYFWIKNSNSNISMARRDSALALQNLIASPRNINIPFAAAVSDNAIALFNCSDIVNNDTRLHITVKKLLDYNDVHQEWSMFDDGTDLGISQEFFDRLNDSMSGEDAQGRAVPDQNLTEKQKYGLSIRPRQTTFSDKFSARKIWVDNVNAVLLQNPMVLLKDISTLQDHDPMPLVDNVTIKFAVDYDTEIEYVNKIFYKLGDRALVRYDSTTNGWTVRQLSVDPADRNKFIWEIVQVQTYDLRNYWTYADWYAKQFSANTPIKKILDYNYEISSANIEVGDVIKINNGDNGNWKLILVNANSLELVGQQNSTIQFNSNLYDNTGAGFGIDNTSFEITPFAKDSAKEFRKIFNVVNNNLLNEGLRGDFKNVVKVMIDTIATQFKQSDWLFKTSLLNIKNNVRSLDQIPVYVKEPDTIINQFIDEVKPYHTKIKEYVNSYDKLDLSGLDIVDFDLPPYFNSQVGKYREPQLGNPLDITGEVDANDNYISLLTTYVYKSWLDNHTYGINSIDIKDGGISYTSDVVINIVGDGVGATAQAFVRGGIISDVVVTNPGRGYTYAVITLTGVGTGAKLYAKLGNATARTIQTTMDFSRFTYNTQTRDWKANTYYKIDDVLLYNNVVYRIAVANLLDTVTEFTVLKVKDFTISDGGSDYRVGDILTVDGGSSKNPVVYEAAKFKVVDLKATLPEIDISNAGTGYVVGNRLVFTSHMKNPVVLRVASVGSPAGNITSLEVVDAGSRIKFPELTSINYDNLEQGSGDSNLGRDAKVFLSWAVNSVEMITSGTYTVLPNSTASTTTNSQFGGSAKLNLTYEIKGIITDSTFSETYLRVYIVRHWKPYTSYNKDDIVVYNSIPYIALTNFSSDRYFNYNSNIYTTNSDEWQPNSNYAKGTVLNYNGIAYTVTDDHYDASQPNPDPVNGDNHKTPVVFNENHLSTIFSLSGYTGGYFDDAATNVWAYYKPAAGMPGHDLEQVMTGIRYPGVSVTGVDFDQKVGFDFGIYEQISYDTRTFDENGLLEIYGSQALDSTYYSLFRDNQLGFRPEDQLIDGAAYVDENSSHAPEELVPGHMFDTLDIKVKTLANINGILSAPELVVVGTYSDGVTKNYSFDPIVTKTNLPASGVEHVFVLSDLSGPQVENKDYVVDYEKMNIEFFNAPPIPGSIFITIIGTSGENIISNSSFIGNGIQTDFEVTDFLLANIQQAYVKINSEMVTDWSILRAHDAVTWHPNQYYSMNDYLIFNDITYRVLEDFKSADTFDTTNLQSADSIVIRFDNAPANGAIIDIGLYNIPTPQKAYSHVQSQIHVVPADFTASQLDYEISLNQPVEYVQPYEAMVSVKVNNSFIEPSSQAYYKGDGITKRFSLPVKRTVDDVTRITDSDIVVVVDKITKTNNIDYSINRNGVDLPTITFIKAPAKNSKITISNRSMSQYVIYNNNKLNIKANYNLRAGDKIEVISYSNHNSYDISVEVFNGSIINILTTELGFEEVGFDLTGFENEHKTTILTPTYTLSRPVNNINNFRITLNGAQLIPYYDFSFVTPTIVRIDTAYGITSSDVIVTQHISEDVIKEKIEYRIFKGITETYEYLGIGNSTTTRLSKDLLIDDKWIYVDDITVLSQPDPNISSPGIVFINGERITFYVIDFVNNRLGQLRRATNGTGAPGVHLRGTRVDDAGYKVEIPGARDSYIVADTEKTLVGKKGNTVNVDMGSLIRQGHIWLNNGTTSAADGSGIMVSDTTQINFLRSL